MNTEYGYSKIHYDGKEYSLNPSFENLAKVGSPKYIVSLFSFFRSKNFNYVSAFSKAATLLNKCGLPEFLTGNTCFSERSGKLVINMGKIEPEVVFILADHCLRHGVVGVIDHNDEEKNQSKGDPITEFDPNEFIMQAVELLGFSVSEAEKLTMTHYVYLARAKVKNIENRKNYDEKGPINKEKDHEEAMKFYREKVEKVNEQHKKKEAKEGDHDSIAVLKKHGLL